MYTVVWRDAAVEQIQELFEEAAAPDAVTDAIRELDRMLSTDPKGNSESRPGTQRVAFARPLGVKFRVISRTRIVEIGDVWRIRPT